jgi:pantoate--beta-alanine ligase
MGQKDYQQFIIVQTMVERLKMDVDVIPCPIVREPDGLAMSSRNLRLTPESREKAVIIHNTLRSVQDKVDTYSDLEDVQEWAIQKLSIDGFRPEYFEIVNARTLKSVNKLNEAKEVIACTAVWAGDIRLIDNTFLKKNI